jgi:hypothetical protein
MVVIPHKALSWMILNEVEASTSRIEDDLFAAKPAEAQAELCDVLNAVHWLESAGVDVTKHIEALPSDEFVAKVLAWKAQPAPTAITLARFRRDDVGSADADLKDAASGTTYGVFFDVDDPVRAKAAEAARDAYEAVVLAESRA